MLFECTSDANDIADALFLLLTLITVCGKMLNFIVKRKVIANIMRNLQTEPLCPQDTTEFSIYNEGNDTAKSYTLMYGIFIETSCMMLILTSVNQDIPNRQLPYKAWLPFNITPPMRYWMVYSQQTLGLAISANMNIGFDTFVMGLMMMTCTQLKIFKYRFAKMHEILECIHNLIDDTIFIPKRIQLEKELFANCVRHHIAILQFAETSNQMFNASVFLQYCNSSLVLCVSTYRLSQMELFTQEFFSLVMYLGCMLSETFIICQYATEMKLESEHICEGIYKTHWTSLTVNSRKSMVTIMARSLRPITYKVAHITLSLDSFCNLLKLNYSAYNVLQRSSL